MLDLISRGVDIVLHLNVHLAALSSTLGPWTYVILFLIVFAETGLVIFPFLPGDSMLFALGAIAALPNSGIDLMTACGVLTIAAILGDALNYKLGTIFSDKLLDPRKMRWINPAHLIKTQKFYETHGGKTIIFARFLPIVRTFAPFVAGIGKMSYRRFVAFNIVGAVLWVFGLTMAGSFFGNIPSIQRNFHLVIFGIIGVSFMPLLVELALQLRAQRAAVRTRD